MMSTYKGLAVTTSVKERGSINNWVGLGWRPLSRHVQERTLPPKQAFLEVWVPTGAQLTTPGHASAAAPARPPLRTGKRLPGSPSRAALEPHGNSARPGLMLLPL